MARTTDGLGAKINDNAGLIANDADAVSSKVKPIQSDRDMLIV